MTPSSPSTGLRVIRALLILVFFGLFFRLGGFLVTGVLIGRIYGSGEVTDAYFGAYQCVIVLLSSIAVKAIMPALMPLFIEEMSQRGEDSAWRFASGVVNLVLIAALLAAGACIVFAPQIMPLLVPGFFAPGREAGPLSVTLVRLMAPGLIALCLSVVTYALLNSYKVFTIPSAAEAAQKLVWAAVLFIAILFWSRGAAAIAIGFLAGAAVQVAINLFGLRAKLRQYRPTLGGVRLRRLILEALILLAFSLATGVSWWALASRYPHTSWPLGVLMAGSLLYLIVLWWRAKDSKGLMGRFMALMAPLLLGILVAKYRDLATNYFTSYTPSGMFSDKQFAERVGNLPTVLWAYALAIAMFPYLCEMASRKDLASFGSLITRALRMIALFFVPFSLIVAVLAVPIVQLLYDNGSWPAVHVRYCGLALSMFSLGMLFYAIENVIMQSFFSIQRMWTPTAVGVLASLGQIAFLYIGVEALGYRDNPITVFWFVIIAYPLSRTVKNGVLLFILRHYVPILPAKETIRFAAQLAAVTAIAVGVTYGCYRPIAKVLNVNALKAEDIVVDTFNPGERNALGEQWDGRSQALPGWRAVRVSGLRIENIATAEEPAEYAMRLDTPGFCVERDLSRFDLRRARSLSFKAKAERDVLLRVSLVRQNGREDFQVYVKRSLARQKYEVRLEKGAEAPGSIKAAVFEDASAAGANGSVWLDTLVFPASLSAAAHAKFELYKLLQAAIPMTFGLAGLLLAAMALRVEEIRLVYTWLKDEGWARIRAKIRGGKGAEGPPAGPKPGTAPDLD